MSTHHHAHRVYLKAKQTKDNKLGFGCSADIGKPSSFEHELDPTRPLGTLLDAFTDWYGSENKLFFVFDGP